MRYNDKDILGFVNNKLHLIKKIATYIKNSYIKNKFYIIRLYVESNVWTIFERI